MPIYITELLMAGILIEINSKITQQLPNYDAISYENSSQFFIIKL
jgi:hypothetical protein